MAFNQEKALLREHAMQVEAKLAKTEKMMADGLRRERDLMNALKKMEESEQVKKGLREVEKRELDKINRLLFMEKI